MPRASARHILVKTREQADKLKQALERGEDFGKLARKHSQCPSGKQGGSLGEFNRGDMVKPFDDAVFKGPLNTVQGPIKTRFGFHLIITLYRT